MSGLIVSQVWPMHLWLAGLLLVLLACGAASWGVLWLLDARRPRVLCLMYHRFASAAEYRRRQGTERVFTVSIENFEQQVASLMDAGYSFVSAEQVHQFAAGSLQLPQPCVMITIDDGCRSVAELALPVLERYQACATVFVTTDPDSYVFKLGDGLDGRLSNRELHELDGRTLRFESHAVTHRPLRGLPEDELRRELLDSRRHLEAILGRVPAYFAVPGNWYDRQVMSMARKVGYEAVWCSRPGAVHAGDALFGLSRVNVEGQLTLAEFIRALHPFWLARRRLLSAVKRIPARLLGPRHWLPLRTIIMRWIPGHHLSMQRMTRLSAVVLLLLAAAVLWLLR
jgi:peptidoglycan/xylan/chitin deacetylase (PgdA/CDA1 family)